MTELKLGNINLNIAAVMPGAGRTVDEFDGAAMVSVKVTDGAGEAELIGDFVMGIGDNYDSIFINVTSLVSAEHDIPVMGVHMTVSLNQIFKIYTKSTGE